MNVCARMHTHSLGGVHISMHQLLAVNKLQTQRKLVGPADHMISRVLISVDVSIDTSLVQYCESVRGERRGERGGKSPEKIGMGQRMLKQQ